MAKKQFTARDFVKESNMIENIHRPPSKAEMQEFFRFMQLQSVSIAEMMRFVKVYQPNARLRDRDGLNVYVGNHFPPPGGMRIVYALEEIMAKANGVCVAERAYNIHHEYETLHPFTDGNGRSGRMLWCWMMRDVPYLGFLHTWYYQSLQYGRKET